MHHHDRGENKNSIVAEADHLSANERESSDETFTRIPMQSIFSGVRKGGTKAVNGHYFYAPSSLGNKALYPKRVDSKDFLKKSEQEIINSYEKIVKNLQEDLAKLRGIEDFDAAVDSVLAAFEKHLSLVPSVGYKNVADISLYDHSRMTAAIASCLAEAGDSEKPFLFVEGDISGIQDYIYSINNGNNKEKNMAKRLRGRSFEVSLLTDAVIAYLLRKLGLNRVSVVFSGGGNFILLVPGTEENRGKMKQAEEEINRFFLERYTGRVGLVLAQKEVDREGVKDFNKTSFELKEVMGREKARKFNGILEGGFFGPYDFSEDSSDICSLCGRDYPKGSSDCCSQCNSQVLLGEKLAATGNKYDSTMLIRTAVDAGLEQPRALVSFDGLGIAYSFYGVGENLDPGLFKNVLRADFLSLNSTRLWSEQIAESKCTSSCSFMFAGTNVPLGQDGNIVPFDELAEEREDAYPRISVMRLDVDDLGYLFSSGLENMTVSRFSTFSRFMNYFFLWYVNDIAEEHRIYITYSGGDDLFVVGNWKDVIEFSLDFHEKFREYTCSNDALTASAGIGIFRENYPIRFAAQKSGELEERSKKESELKNRITLFDTTVSWDRLKEMNRLAGDIYDLLEENKNRESQVEERAKIKASLIYKIYSTVSSGYRKLGNKSIEEWISLRKYMIKYILSRRGMGHVFMEGDNLSEDMLKKRSVVKQLVQDDVLKDFAVPGSIVIYSARKRRNR